MELWRRAGKFDASRGSEPAFVATIARRRIIDATRRRGRREEALPDFAEPVSECAVPDEDADAARAALEELEPTQRQVLWLSVFEDLSHSKIAERLKLPLGTVKTHARRGVLAIREKLTRREQAAEIRRQTFRRERGLDDA